MKKDGTELHDLSATMPDKAKELAEKWDAWADRAHVRPYFEAGAPKTPNGEAKKAKGAD